MITVSGKPTSANVQKVLWTLQELGVAFEHLPEHPQFSDAADRSYVAFRGRPAPVMVDGDFVLWEANAITRYLALKHGAENLLPSEPRIRASVERWMDYQQSTARVHLHALLRDDLERTQILEHARELERCMEPVAAALSERSYLVGDAFTLADIPLGIVTYRWFLLDVPRPNMPALARWHDRLCARPAFKRAVVPPVNTKVSLIA